MTVEWLRSPATDVAYPAAPWRMVGSMWLTVFRVGHRVDDLRPAGVYGAAFVSYVVIKIVKGKLTEVHPLLWAVAVAFLVYFMQNWINSVI